jgi:hyperosmotically inducible protein
MKTTSFSLILSALLLTGCAAQPVNTAPAASSVVTDLSGRVVRTRPERNQDDSIGRAILTSLRQADATAFKGVSVLAWDRAVLLTGAVSKPEQRRRAAQIAKDWPNVRIVLDDLVLAEDPTSTVYVPDTYREQRIYAGLLGRDDVTGAYVVRMVNGVVTLMGTARTAEDVAKATAFVRDFEGVKWVVDHVEVR